jgi:F-type H+-transporting ATPase subunit b
MTVDFSLIGVILNFVLLLFILNRLLYKPLKGFFDDRQKKIKEDLEEAERLSKIANERVTEKNEELNNFRAECRGIKEKIVKDAEAEREAILHAAKVKENELIKHTEGKIIELNKRAVEEIESKLSEIVADLASKVLAEKIDDVRDKELINKLLAKRG